MKFNRLLIPKNNVPFATITSYPMPDGTFTVTATCCICGVVVDGEEEWETIGEAYKKLCEFFLEIKGRPHS